MNMSSQKIADHLGIGRSLVTQKAKELGLRKSKIPFIPFENEEIKDIGGEFPNYQVTSFGRVINKQNNTLLKQKVVDGEYPKVTMASIKRGKGIEVRIHRYIADAFIPNPDNKPQTNHKDGNKHNNHISNLEWVTQKENTQHAYDIGLIPKGEHHHYSKINKKQALEIIEFIKSGLTDEEILACLSYTTKRIIEKIRYKENWKDLWY